MNINFIETKLNSEIDCCLDCTLILHYKRSLNFFNRLKKPFDDCLQYIYIPIIKVIGIRNQNYVIITLYGYE